MVTAIQHSSHNSNPLPTDTKRAAQGPSFGIWRRRLEYFKIRAVTHKNKTVSVTEDVDDEDLANDVIALE
jgi:hypothetical protein